jgi:predicted nucleic acid-binding protein
VFVDTNVFYPVRLADLVLSSVGDGLFDLCVSDHLLDEIERVLIHDKGLTQLLARQKMAITRYFAKFG